MPIPGILQLGRQLRMEIVFGLHRTTEVMEPVLEDIGEVLREKTAVKWGVNINHVVKKKAY
jgi:hypothetical protein